MRAKTLPLIFIIGLAVAFTFHFIAIAAIDAPHEPHDPNITNICTYCHGETVLTSPFWGTGTYDQLCLSCHRRSTGGPYSQTDAPPVTTHSDSSGSALAECRDCHNPHYQRQKVYKNTDPNNYYLAKGQFTGCSYDSNNNTSTLTYSTITYKAGWEWNPPTNTKLTKKTSDYRRTILFPHINKLGYNYSVITIDTSEKKITVEGNVTAYGEFAVIYGQYIKDLLNTKTVKFFDKIGQNSFAYDESGTEMDTMPNGICQVCHNNTQHWEIDGTRADHYNSKDCNPDDPDDPNYCEKKICVGCHSHVEGFKIPESEGSVACQDCHSDTWEYMNGTTGYHHYMNNAGNTYATISQPANMGSSSDTNRNCLMCHVDHDIFRFDKNSNGARAKNLRASISVTPSAGNTTTYSNTDFNNAQTDGGICISCHATEQTKSYAQADNTTKTPAVTETDFNLSAHNYTASSTFARDSSSFNANCSKCHNDTLNPKSRFNSQSSTDKFGNHQSTLRRVTATLGITSPTDLLEEDFCYRCHSKTTDSNPGGGPAKGTAKKDYYNVASMKSDLTISDTLYFGETTNIYPLPDTSASTDTFQGGTWQACKMLPTQQAGQWVQSVNITDFDPLGAPKFWRMTSFVSPAVASTTSIPAGTWTLKLLAYEDAAPVNARMRTTIYVWTASDMKGTVILPPTSYDPEIPIDGQFPIDHWNVTGGAVTLNPGDRIVVEVEIDSRRISAPSGIKEAHYTWGNNGFDNKVIIPASLPFLNDYNAVVFDTAPSENIYTIIQKGYVLPKITNKLYFRETIPLEPAPNESGSTDTFSGGTWQAREMLVNPVVNWASQQSQSVSIDQTGGPLYWRMTSFVSPPVSSTTSIPAGTWRLNLYANAANNVNARFRVTIYVWTASDTKGAVILAPVNYSDELIQPSGTGIGWPVAGSAAELDTGDRIVVEIEIKSNATSSGSATFIWNFGGYSGVTMPTHVPFLQEVRNYSPNTTTDTLFLRETIPSGSVPVASGSPDTFSGGTWQSREMLITPGGASESYHEVQGQYVQLPMGSSTGNPSYWRMTSFVSLPVASTTSIPPGTWTLRLWASEARAEDNAYMLASIYVWTAANTKGTVILAPTSYFEGLTPNPPTYSPIGYDWAVQGWAATLNTGDRIVVELEIETKGETCPTFTACGAGYYWNGDGEMAESKIIMPISIPFLPRIGHKVAIYSGIHKPSSTDETQTYISNNKHVECGDCHNVHATGKTKHTIGTNLVSDVLKGVSGAIATYSGTPWTSPSYTFDTSTKEYEICFKCHSSANTNAGKWFGSWNPSGYWWDVAHEFNPNNMSSHPVVAPSGPRALDVSFMTSDWSNVGNQTMYCSDCHGSDASDSNSPSGPHASYNKYMLAPYKKGLKGYFWPTKSDGYTYWTLGDSNDPDLFCNNCHKVHGNFCHSAHNELSCLGSCHSEPHGSTFPRLLGGLVYTKEVWGYTCSSCQHEGGEATCNQ